MAFELDREDLCTGDDGDKLRSKASLTLYSAFLWLKSYLLGETVKCLG